MTKGWDQAAVDRAKERIGGVVQQNTERFKSDVLAKANLSPRKSKLNKGEAQYAQVLEAEKRAGRITDYRFEAVKLRLADNTHLTMDFLVIDCDGFVQLHDVKALWSHGKVGVQEDANIKMKVAASQYPYFQFLTVWKEKNGMWNKKTY